ncbi:MAG TPA: hypothetical protein VNG51_06905 [Ktedonobacteraceae bacterium]|nr:hypothetical protein [Ktedonobacteraceae bacterium]
MSKTSKASQSSWQIHPSFCELTFDNQTYPISMETTREEEPYRSHTPQREFVPLTVTDGIRTKVAARFSIPLQDSRQAKQFQRIGEAQVWLYHEDNILLFWRCNLLAPYKVANPVEDQNLHTLWHAFEHYLLEQFPRTVQFLTPSWNRPYDERLWNQFIHMHGYTQPSPAGLTNAAFIKVLK